MEYFRVANLEKYQNSKHRNPKWLKLYSKIIDSYKFEQMPDNTKAHMFTLIIVAARHGNVLPYDKPYLRKKLCAKSNINLERLLEDGFIEMVTPDEAALDARIAAAEAPPETPEPKEISGAALFIRDTWPSLVAGAGLKLSQVRLQSNDDNAKDPKMLELRELIDTWCGELNSAGLIKRLSTILVGVKTGAKWYSLKALLADSEQMKGKSNDISKAGRVNDADHTRLPEWAKNKTK